MCVSLKLHNGSRELGPVLSFDMPLGPVLSFKIIAFGLSENVYVIIRRYTYVAVQQVQG